MDNPVHALLQTPQAAIMGIVNATPDSFFDGGTFNKVGQATKHALLLVDQGADIIDVGGESTRPGAKTVSVQEELDRVLPVIEAIAAETSVPISVDTSKAEVMHAALLTGAAMINDVNALQADGAVGVVAKHQVPVCLMHKQGDPKTMQLQPSYEDVVEEVIDFLQSRIDVCVEQGIKQQNIIVDPGIGFGKTLSHNLTLLANSQALLKQLQCPLLIGVSRKSMIGALIDRELDQRLSASVGLAVQAVLDGAKIVRVHDVAETYDAIRCVEAVQAMKI